MAFEGITTGYMDFWGAQSIIVGQVYPERLIKTPQGISGNLRMIQAGFKRFKMVVESFRGRQKSYVGSQENSEAIQWIS